MLVIRVFDVLDGLTAQFASHVTCCASGTCPEPDEVAYESRQHGAYETDDIVPIVAEIFHTHLSALGGRALSGIVQNHLGMLQR